MSGLMLNKKAILKNLNLIEDATNQAMNECPKTSDSELDIYQQNVIDHVSAFIVDARHSSVEELSRLEAARRGIESEIEGFSLHYLIDSAAHKIFRMKAEWSEILNNAKKKEGVLLRNYRYFTFQNKLKREPVYPESAVFHWALILLAVLLESVVNSFFFASASDLGLLGGLFQALFISIANIGSALLVGMYVIPYKNHIEAKKQFRAKAATLFYIVFALLFNLATAHYRTLLEIDPTSAKSYAIPRMFQDPLGINFESWNLLIIGMLFVIVALIKGYKSDDVYPGFGEIHRKLKDVSNYREKKIEAIKSINNVVDEHCGQAISSSQSIRQKVGNYKNLILRSEEVLLEFSKFVESAEVVCNNVLWEYRSANSRVRSSEPPAYFSQRHSFDSYQINSDLSKEHASCQKIEARLDEIQNNENQKLHEGLRNINEKALEDMASFFGKS